VKETETEPSSSRQLSPIQQRNLEKAWAPRSSTVRASSRIFGRRASTAEGTLQVELAHLQYQKSRLVPRGPISNASAAVGFWAARESQLGPTAAHPGGISRIEKQLESVVKTGPFHRRAGARALSRRPLVATQCRQVHLSTGSASRGAGQGLSSPRSIRPCGDPTAHRPQDHLSDTWVSSPTCRPRSSPPSSATLEECSRRRHPACEGRRPH